MNHVEEISAELYRKLESLIQTGKVELSEGKLVDFSSVQVIRIEHAKVTFDPPARISAKFGPIRVNTTLTEIRKTGTGIKVDIDNSPLDLEIRPHV